MRRKKDRKNTETEKKTKRKIHKRKTKKIGGGGR